MADHRNSRDTSTPISLGAADDITWAFGLVNAAARDIVPQASPSLARLPLGSPDQDATPGRQIVFIDGNVSDAGLLAAGVAPGVTAVILDPNENGVQQIAAWLTGHDVHQLAAIDIVAHGADGLLDLGNTQLDSATIGQNLDALAAIGAALRPGGDIQIYGCDVAQSAGGDAFLDQLSKATGGANIAASSNPVGSATLGGSWTLNVDVGTVDVGAPFTAAALSAYPDLLPVASPTDKIVFDASNGDSGPLDIGDRIEQISATGSTFVSGSTVDIADASQSTDSGLGNNTSGIAVDTALNEYFTAADNTATHVLTIQRGNAVGAGSTLTTFFTNPFQDFNGGSSTVAAVGGLALDPLHGELYYAQAAVDSNGNPVAADTGIYKVSIAGSTGTPTLLTPSSNSLFQPTDLALDVKDNLLFFTDAFDSAESFGAFPSVNNLDVANLNTGAITVLHSFTTQESADANFILQGLAVDSANDEIYLATANFGTNSSTDNAILKIPFTPSGSGNAATASIGTISTLYSGAGADLPQNIAIDVAQGILYTAGQLIQSGTTYGAIFEGSLNGGVGSLTAVESMLSIVPTTSISPAAGDLIPELVVLTSPTVTASGTVTAVSGGASVTADSGAAATEPDGQLLTGATVSGILTGDTLSYNGGAAHVFTDGFTISSAFGGGTLTLSGNASAADYQSALDAVGFSTTSSSATPRTLDWTVNDASFVSAISTTTVNVHVAPTVVAGATATFEGGGGAVALDSGLSVSDASSTTLVSARVVDSGFISGDTMTVGTAGGLSTSFSSGTLTLTGTASLATYQTALETVDYGFTAGGDPTGGGSHTSRAISWSVNDGVASSSTAGSTVDTTHVNPSVTAGASVRYHTNEAPLVLDAGLVVSDPDSGGTLTGATVSIGGGFLNGDTLDFANQNGITGSYANGSGTLTLSGSASIADYQTALESVGYSFSGDPTNGNTDAGRTIDWTVTDGVGTSARATSSVATVCFCLGTSIATPRGEVPVERLAVGDMVVTWDGAVHEPRPVTWIGHRRLDLGSHPRPEAVAPVRIRRGAFAENLPRRDLRLSPDHSVFVDGKLIPARLLINDMTITREAGSGAVTYFHVELERHAVLLAEGLPAESYLDTGNRAFFANGGGAVTLYPAFDIDAAARCWKIDACAPLEVGTAAVEPIWRRLAERAESLGYVRWTTATTEDADLRLLADGRVLRPVTSDGGRHMFVLPRGVADVRLASRAAAPSELAPYVDDSRRLGVAVSRIAIRSAQGQSEIPCDHPALLSGWHAVERDGDAQWRWTDGNAQLPIIPEDGPLAIVVCVSRTMIYRLAIPPLGRSCGSPSPERRIEAARTAVIAA